MTIFKTISLLMIVTSLFAFSSSVCESIKTNDKGIFYHCNDTAPEVISPEKTVIAFLKWYKHNEERLYRIQLLTGGLKDTATFYSVDFKATEKYLVELKKSGFVSYKFLEDLQQHFLQTNEYLEQHPQNDGPAPGFEADLIMKAQDYMDVWEDLDHAKVIDKNIDGKKASIKFLFAGYYKTKYYLTRHSNKWLIDKIENAFFEK